MTKWIQDGGHGGDDPGATANGIIEKVYTLEASLYVNKRLNDLDIKSHVTRTNDVTFNSRSRASLVSKYDKCISHHFNAGGGHGFECIHSIHSDGSFEKILLDEFKKAKFPIRKYPIYTRTLPNYKNTDYYFMNRQTGKARTTIVEYDFVDGKNAEKLKNKDYRIRMYECVVRAICRDEGVKYKAPNETTKDEVFYRVVTGSYKNKDNAYARMKELKNKGYDSFIDVFKK